jgi:hypothetical protein
LILDAAGTEVLAFEDIVRQIAFAFGAKPGIIHVSPQTVIGSIGPGNLSFNMSRLDGRHMPGPALIIKPFSNEKLNDPQFFHRPDGI